MEFQQRLKLRIDASECCDHDSLPGRGIREVSYQVWLVSSTEFDLGFSDGNEQRVEATVNPSMPTVLSISAV